MIATAIAKPYKKEGIWHYPELPAGMRTATISDFEIITPELRFGVNILFKPDLLDYQANNIRNAENLEKWKSDITAGKVFVDKLPYKQRGLYYYPSYPIGCRPAAYSDFLTSDNSVIINVDFLVLSSISTEYEAHRTSTLEKLIPWLDWLAAGRVFVKL